MNPEEFGIRLSDVPDAISEEVRQVADHHTVPLIINDEPVGSGTLVQIDEYSGILTAEHVVNHPRRSDLRLIGLTGPPRQLSMAIAEFPHAISIPSDVLRIVKTGARADKSGPDLAFIAIPPSPLLQELNARKSFANLNTNVGAKLESTLADRGFFAVCGYPRKTHWAPPAALGFADVRGLRGYSFLSGAKRYFVRDRWDFFDIDVDPTSLGEIQGTFGGVSGGGMWRYHIQRRAGDPPGTETLGSLHLAGVAFYEEETRGAEHTFLIRGHGPRSIYEQFVNEVRQALRGPTLR